MNLQADENSSCFSTKKILWMQQPLEEGQISSEILVQLEFVLITTADQSLQQEGLHQKIQVVKDYVWLQ